MNENRGEPNFAGIDDAIRVADIDVEDAIRVPGEIETFADEPELADDELRGALEAMLLIADAPVAAEQFAAATVVPVERVTAMLQLIAQQWQHTMSGFDLRESGEGWRIYSRADYAPYIEKLLLGGARTKLTRAALETLAVIAYRQPASRAKVSAVRGVNVDGVMRTLLGRGLIAEAVAESDSGATQYQTTELFLERLGLASLDELPDLAPLLPDVEVIDELGDEINADPRFFKLEGKQAESTRESVFAPDSE